MSTRNYVDLENLSTFWDKAKDYINTSDSELEKKVDDVDSKIDTEIERSTNKDSAIDQEIAEVKESVTSLNTTLSGKIDDLEEKDLAIDQEIAEVKESVTSKIESLEEKDSAIDLEIAGVKESVTSINTTLSGKIDDLEEKDSAIDQEIAGVKESVTSLNTTLSGKIDDLEEKDSAIDQEIAGVKESIKAVNDSLNIEIQRSGGEDDSIKQRVKALEDANPIYNIVGDEDNVLVDITFTKEGNNVTASLDETALSTKITELEDYQVTGQKLSSGEVNLTSTDIKVGNDIDEYIDAYKADATIYETLTQLKRTIAATGGGSRIVAVLDELPETTGGFSTGDIILVDLKEYLCAPDAIGSDTTRWYLLGDVTDEGRRLSEIEASYVKSVKVAGIGVDVTPTEDTNGNVTISVDASSITREIETLKNADKVSSITTKDGTYVKLTPDSKTIGDVEISVDDNAIATALAERVSKTGDTMNGALTITTPYDQKLVFNNTDSEYFSLISFSQNGTRYAAFGTAGNDQPRWYDTNGSHEMLHSGNYNKYALPLSGGTMSGAITLPADISIDDANGSTIFGYDSTGLLRVGQTDKDLLLRGASAKFNDNILIHSGNLFDYKSQLTNRYSDCTGSGPSYIKLGYLPVSNSHNYASFHIHGVIGGWGSNVKSKVDLIVSNRDEVIIFGSIHNFGTGYWDIYVNNSLEIILALNSTYVTWDIELNSLQGTVDYQNNYTPADTNWTISAHSSSKVTRFDSNGNLMKDVTGNAGSATKLATPRLIYGTLFDGTGDITGPLCLYGASGVSYDMWLDNQTLNGVNFRRNDNSSLLFVSDHVGVGTTTPQAKLHVNGDVMTRNAIHCFGNYGGFSLYSGVRDGEALSIERLSSAGSWVGPGVTLFNNGNVAIGGGSADTKLHVHGDAIFQNARVNKCLKVGYQGNPPDITRSQLLLISESNVPCDLYLGADNSPYWSITARNVEDSINTTLAFYNVRQGNYSMGLHPNGNVFIGGVANGYAAEEKLHVHGNVKATSFIGNLTGNVTGTASGNLPLSGGLISGGNIAFNRAGLPTINSANVPAGHMGIASNGILISGKETYNDGAAIFVETTANESNKLIIALGDDANNNDIMTNDYIAFRYYGTDGVIHAESKIPNKTGTIALTTDIPTYGLRVSSTIGKFYLQQNGSDYVAATLNLPTSLSYFTNDVGYTTATGHTHDWSNINNVVVANNEFNFVPSWFNTDIWLNYRGKDFSSATVTGYRFGNGAGGCAPLYASNFITTSDRRLKKNITEIDDDRLKKSLDLNFYEFDYRNTAGHSAGHVAQDVKEVLPEFVRENNSKKDDINYLSLDYTGLHSMQIKALKNKCERLEDENKSLQSRIEKLEKLIEKLL